MSEELKPCQCGDKVNPLNCPHVGIKHRDKFPENWIIFCQWTGIRIKTIKAKSKQAAIQAWNRRHNDGEAKG